MATEATAAKPFWTRLATSLVYRNFRLLFISTLTEHFAEFIEIAAVLWLTYDLTRSPLWLTVVGASRSIPMIVFAAWGGVVVDRADRRAVLLYSLAVSGILAIAMAALVHLGTINLWQIIAITVGQGVAQSFNHPARQALVPNTVPREHLLNALSLDNIAVHASRLMAMPLAGFGITIFGVTSLFGIKALGCLATIIVLLFASIPRTPTPPGRQTPWHDLVEGFRYVRGNSVVLSLLLLYLVPMLSNNAYINLLPAFATDILDVGAIGYGFLQAAPGLGAVLTILAIAALTTRRRKGRFLFVSAILLGVSLMAFALSRWSTVSLVLLVVVGGTATTFMVVNNTLVQVNLPDHVRGRVMSLREIAMGLGPSGGIMIGYLAQVTSIPASLAVLGAGVAVLSSVLLATMSRVTKLE